MKLSRTTEDYLKTIYLLSQKTEVHGAHIAEELGVSKPTVSVSLKALEREGYITRAMGDEDHRRNTVRITEEGLRKVEESHRIFEAMDKAAFAGFSDAELAALTETLRRMADNLRAATEKNAAGAEKSEQGKEEIP